LSDLELDYDNELVRQVITDTAVLRRITDGLIHNPFDKRLHVVPCESIDAMQASKNDPKWHFARADEAEVFLDQHHAKWGGKDWDYAACWRRPEAPDHEPLREEASNSRGISACRPYSAI
jgi:hypothetical protein